MNSQQVQDMRLMYGAVYNDELWELANEYNNTIYDEDIVEVATEYFYTYGLNEDGIDILIEKVGLDNFVEFVYDLSEDLTILAEERSAKKRTGGESYADVKAKIDAKEAAKKKAKEEALKRKESERMEPASNGADTESKKEQPKSKKPIRDAIARQILAGMKRHREATQTAGRLAGETGKTLGKIASVTREAGRRAGEHVKKHGLKSLANEETEIGITGKKIPKPGSAKKQYELEKKRRMKKHLGQNVGGTQYSSDVNPYLNPRSVREEVLVDYLLDEGFASDEKSAQAIANAMSEAWIGSIVEAVDPDYTGPSQDPLSRASRAIGSAVKFAMGQQGAEVRAKQKGIPGNVFVKQSGPFSTKNVPTKGSFISDTEMKRRGQSTKPMGPIGQ